MTTAGASYCWGYNAGGQLGDGTATSRSTPVTVVGNLTFSSLSAGGFHTCGVTASATAFCWGYNAGGQLGDGTTTDRWTPVNLAGNLAFTGLGAGRLHTCGMTSSGISNCWGENAFGQLGDGTTTSSASPVQVVGFPPPTANAGGPYGGAEGSLVSFDGSASTDPGSNPLTYDWDFGDGSPHGSGANPAHAYADNGSYTVMLTVNNGVLSNAISTTATIGNATPTVTLTLQTPSPIHAGQNFVLRGGFNDAGIVDGPWAFKFFRNTTLLQQGTKPNQPPPGVTQPNTLKINTPGTYTFKLQVTDKDGATGSVSLPVQIVP
jgi:hypothetical protein